MYNTLTEQGDFMARKPRIKEYKLLENESFTADLATTSTTIDMVDTVVYDISWVSADIIAEIKIQVSEDGKDWTDLDFGQPIAMTTADTSHQIVISSITFKTIRIFLQYTSGTATVSAKVTAAGQGA